MLIKKELLGISPGTPPERPADKLERSYHYCAAVKIEELKRSGKVLVVDIYPSWPKKKEQLNPIIRFFSDGHTFQVLTDLVDNKWCTRQLGSLLRGEAVYSGEAGYDLAKKTLNPRLIGGGTISSLVDTWVSALDREKRDRAWKRQAEQQRQHFSMYPPFPNDLETYCEEHIFSHTYAFVDKADKGNRKAVCGHCGAHFTVPSAIRSGGQGICPECNRRVQYRGSWISASIEDKAKICIAEKVDNQLLLRWVKVSRIFEYPKKKPGFCFEDYYYTLYLNTKRGPAIYSYRYMPIMYGYGAWDWVRMSKDHRCYDTSYVYTENLERVFGKCYHNVNLKDGLSGRDIQIPFHFLLDNLLSDPRAEYLFKLGMPSLAAKVDHIPNMGQNGFSGVMGVSKQFMPLYAKHDVRLNEHRIIAAYGKWVSEENLLALREMDIPGTSIDTAVEILSLLSMDRFTRYFHKQKALYPKKKYDWILTEYRDYISMSNSLCVDLSHKSVLMPPDIKVAHDTAMERYNKVKHELEDREFEKAVAPIYAALAVTEFQKDGFCIVLPRLRSDLITEGQSLNHCVGNEGYYKRHIAGTDLIFFIRKVEAPQKPFFTMEIGMGSMSIKQLYGFGDCSAPKEVRAFAEAFVRRLKSGTAERKTA